MGVGVMTLMQTIAEVTKLRREIDEQIRLIEDYKHANRYNHDLVQTELRGSQRNFDRIMLNSLDRSDRALDNALAQLRNASDALGKVSSI